MLRLPSEMWLLWFSYVFSWIYRYDPACVRLICIVLLVFPKVPILCLSVDAKHYNTRNLDHNFKCGAPEKLHQPDYNLCPFLILSEVPQSQLPVKVFGISFFFSKIFFSARKKTKRIRMKGNGQWKSKNEKKNKDGQAKSNTFLPYFIAVIATRQWQFTVPRNKVCIHWFKVLRIWCRGRQNLQSSEKIWAIGDSLDQSWRVFSHAFCFFLNRLPNIIWQRAGGPRVGSASWDRRGTGTSTGCSRSRRPCGHC